MSTRATSVYAEVLLETVSLARATNVYAEVLVATAPTVYATGVYAEVLLPSSVHPIQGRPLVSQLPWFQN